MEPIEFYNYHDEQHQLRLPPCASGIRGVLCGLENP